MLRRMNNPPKTNVRIPRDDFVTRRIGDNYEMSQYDFYSFPISKQQKRVDIFKWATL